MWIQEELAGFDATMSVNSSIHSNKRHTWDQKTYSGYH